MKIYSCVFLESSPHPLAQTGPACVLCGRCQLPATVSQPPGSTMNFSAFGTHFSGLQFTTKFENSPTFGGQQDSGRYHSPNNFQQNLAGKLTRSKGPPGSVDRLVRRPVSVMAAFYRFFWPGKDSSKMSLSHTLSISLQSPHRRSCNSHRNSSSRSRCRTRMGMGSTITL